jgi:hypothetical protein
MKLESDAPTPGEPEDGWQRTPDLSGSEILSLALCKFTGFRIESLEEPCPWADEHAPEQCVTLYHSAVALQRGDIDITQYPADVPVVEVRASNPSDDPIARTHA